MSSIHPWFIESEQRVQEGCERKQKPTPGPVSQLNALMFH